LLTTRQISVAVIASLVGGPIAGAQASATAPQTVAPQANIPTLKVTARLVVLDVVVTDKAGNLVPGLSAKDFTIYEDKTPQKIRSFEGPQLHVLPPGVEINSTADLAKAPNAPVSVLVLDELNTRFSDMSFARQSLEKYLKAQPAVLTQPTTLLVVSNTKFVVLHDYTLDRQALLTALDKHFPEYPWRMMNSGKGGPGAAERLAMSLGSLEQIAQATSGHPGRKNIVWVGPGFPAINTAESTDKEAAAIAGAMTHIINVMRDARITLTTIDPTIASSGTVLIETPDDLDAAENDNGSDPFAGDASFQLLAPATGGRVYASRNDVDAEIGESILDGNNYYTLSYAPTNHDDVAQPYRRIGIKMNVPGLTATTRNGYYTQTSAPPPMATSADVKQAMNKLAFDLGSAANSTMAYTGLPVAAHRLSDLPAAFGVSVETKALDFEQKADGVPQAEVTVMVASFNRDNKMIAHQIQEMQARQKPGTEPASTTEFRIPVTIPGGTTRVRVIVRDTVTGKMGTADLAPAAFAGK
jgi:VWFA-related protein